MAGWFDPSKQRMEHMGFGVVLGEDGKRMKTRAGDTVKLLSLLDEAKAEAQNQIKSRIEDAEQGTYKSQLTEEEIDRTSEVLGIGAVKYFDLRQNRIQDYKFDLQAMTSQKGDTAVYLLYSYIRVCSILRKSELSEDDIKGSLFEFTDPCEQALARQIIKFAETIEFVADKMNINGLCFFLYNLATKLSSNYNKYQINNNENSSMRIKLIYAVKILMEKCFYLLGIETLEKI